MSTQPHRFVDGAWRPVQGPRPPHAAPSRLRVLTLNTWFSEYARSQRLDAQLDLLARLQPDVIGLQEVTSDLLRRLLGAPFLREGYATLGRPRLPLAAAGYGVGLFVRPPVRAFGWHPLESEMGRGLLLADLGGLAIGTVHMESMRPYSATRARQMRACQQHLQPWAASVLMGDFNHGPDDPDRPQLSPWVDLWDVARPHEPGFTMDTERNDMLAAQRETIQQRRLDRITLRDQTGRWRVGSIAQVGTAAIGPGVWPSDHFGLVAELVQAPPTALLGPSSGEST